VLILSASAVGAGVSQRLEAARHDGGADSVNVAHWCDAVCLRVCTSDSPDRSFRAGHDQSYYVDIVVSIVLVLIGGTIMYLFP
jgi:hypothetical protein